VSGPLLAIARRPATSNLSEGAISLLYGKPGPSGWPRLCRAGHPLNHDAGNHPVKDEAVEKLFALYLLGFRMDVGCFPDREAHHRVNGNRRFRLEQLAGDISFVGFKRPIQAGLSFVRRRRGGNEPESCKK